MTENPHSGFYDVDQIPRRIKSAIVQPRIIFIIREQAKMISSIYWQYVRIGGMDTLENYIHPRKDDRMPRFDFRPLRYLEIIKLFQKLFGTDQVLVITCEELDRSKIQFLSELSSFLDM